MKEILVNIEQRLGSMNLEKIEVLHTHSSCWKIVFDGSTRIFVMAMEVYLIFLDTTLRMIINDAITIKDINRGLSAKLVAEM